MTRFLDFARPLHAETRPLQVTELIDHALKAVADQWKGGTVVVERDYAQDLPLVPLDETCASRSSSISCRMLMTPWASRAAR